MTRPLLLRRAGLFFRITSPLGQKRTVRRCPGSLREQDSPVFFGVVEQTGEVNVIHSCDSDHCRQLRENPLSFLQTFPHDHQQQGSYQRHPYLYLDGVCAFSIDVFRRKVLFHLFEKQLDFPTLPVYGYDFVRVGVHVIGNLQSCSRRHDGKATDASSA